MLTTVSQKRSDIPLGQPKNLENTSAQNIKAKPTDDESPSLLFKVSEFSKMFFQTFGVASSIILAVVPSWSLVIVSTNMYKFVRAGVITALFTTVLQCCWTKFEQSNKQRILKEKLWLEEFDRKYQIGLEEGALFEGQAAPVGAAPVNVEAAKAAAEVRNDWQRAVYENMLHLYSVDKDKVLNTLLDPDSFSSYQLQCCNFPRAEKLSDDADGLELARKYYDGLDGQSKEKLTSQFLYDNIGKLLEDRHLQRKTANESTIEQSEQKVEDRKTHAKTFKAMSLAAKICKELGPRSDWNSGFLNTLYEKYREYHHPISASKNFVDTLICVAEYTCVYSRRNEIKVLNYDIEALRKSRERLERLSRQLIKNKLPEDSVYVMKSKLALNALQQAIANLEERKKALMEKNKLKIVEIMADLFEAALSGFQDLIELLKIKTAFLKDLPKLVDWLVYIDEGMNVFCSLVALVFDMRKIGLKHQKRKDLKVCQHYYVEQLKAYKASLNKGLKGEQKKKDSFELFLDFKIDALETSLRKRLVSVGQKFIHIFDDTFCSLECTQKILLVAFGISLGSTTSAVISTGATIFTLGSLGFGVYRFCYYDMYLQRHHFAYKIHVIWLKFRRDHCFKPLTSSKKLLDLSVKAKERLELNIRLQNEAIDEMQRDILLCAEEKIRQYGEEIAKIEKGNKADDALEAAKKSLQEFHEHFLSGDIDKLVLHTKTKEYAERYFKIVNNHKKTLEELEEQKSNHEMLKSSVSVQLDAYKDILQRIRAADRILANKEVGVKLKKTKVEAIDEFRSILEAELVNPIKKAEWGRKLKALGFHTTTKPLDASMVLSLAISKNLPAVHLSKSAAVAA